MSKRQWLMLFGALIIIIPFMGFPASWNKTFFIVIGLLIIAVAYKMAPKRITSEAAGEITKNSSSLRQ